jgi:hypothetical protein
MHCIMIPQASVAGDVTAAVEYPAQERDYPVMRAT